MKLFFLLALFSVISCSTISSDREAQWQEFKLKYGKEYRSSAEELKRKTIFMQTLEEIDAHNEKFAIGLSTYKQGINAYSDLTWDEFQERFLMKEGDTRMFANDGCDRAQPPEPNPNTPRAVDWRSIMNPVRSQGCGDCWAFSAIGAIEGAWTKAGNPKKLLSEQQFHDCEPRGGGCAGGGPDGAFTNALALGGVATREEYPYEARDNDYCLYDPSMDHVSISRCWQHEPNTLTSDQYAERIYEHGPMSVGVWANSNFQRYQSGIFDDDTCHNGWPNHSVVNVGYDKDQGYWLIRNSWGEGWGEDGHIKIRMGGDICNVELDRKWSIFV